MIELTFATNNRHKRDEVAAMLKGRYKVHTLAELGIYEDIPETASTLEGNARQKARYVFERKGCNVFADDTGLEVEALDGAPGVHTARYAGESKDPEANMNKLLEALEGQANRRARFRTAICLILDGKEYFFEGIAEGKICETRSGAQGFGYDPIFEPDEDQAPGSPRRTFAEMSQEEKNRYSHRGKAIQSLIAFLNKMAD